MDLCQQILKVLSANSDKICQQTDNKEVFSVYIYTTPDLIA